MRDYYYYHPNIYSKSTQHNPCSEFQFRCGNNVCIPLHLRCDGFYHCNDMTDEFNCEQYKAKEQNLKTTTESPPPAFIISTTRRPYKTSAQSLGSSSSTTTLWTSSTTTTPAASMSLEINLPLIRKMALILKEISYLSHFHLSKFFFSYKKI